MKKRILLFITVAILAILMMCVSVSATETVNENGIICSDTNEYGTVNIIEGYDYSSKLLLDSRMVLDNGDGTYSTYPSAYALDYNKDGKKRGERFQYFDPSILNDETGFTYSHASVIRLEIPEGITIIHHDDRSNINLNTCDSMIEVTFPSTLTTYTKSDLLNGCDALLRADLSKSVKITSIPSSTFGNSKLLTTVILPSSVVTLNASAFYGCTALTGLDISGINTIGGKCFQNCKALTEITLSNEIKSLPQDCFHSCSALTRVNGGGNLETVSNYAFNNCSLLAYFPFNEGIKSIGSYSFQGCALTEFVPPQSLVSIGGRAFGGNKIANALAFGPNLTKIDSQAFYQCSQITSVSFCEGLLTLGKEAFAFCSGLTGEINMPSTVTSISTYTFRGCSQITKVIFPENSQLTGDFTGNFLSCTALTSFYFPKGVGSLAYDVFSGCTSLKEIDFSDSELTAITSGNNFKGCSSLESIYFPNTLLTIADSNFGGCSKLSVISFGDGLTSLGAGNLTLTALKKVYIPSTLTSIGAHILGYTNANDSSKNITFIFTGSFAQAQALRALVKADTANAKNGCKFYDATLLPSSEYDVSIEPVGYHFIYDYSKCDAFYSSHNLTEHNACVDICQRCLHFYQVASPVHNFNGGETIVYEDFAKEGSKTCVCQNEGCTSNDGSSVPVPPIFEFLGYSIFEIGSSFAVDYLVNIDALMEYEVSNGVVLDYGMVGAYVGYLDGRTPLDPETAKAVDISSTGKRIYLHSIRKFEHSSTSIRLTNIKESQYEEEFYVSLYIYDGKTVKYLTGDTSTLMPEAVSYASVRGPVTTAIGSMTYSTEDETVQAPNRLEQMAASQADYAKGSELSSTELQGSGWFNKGIIGKANLVVTGGGVLGYKNAAKFMEHFLGNTGANYNLDVKSFLNSDSGALNSRNTSINNALRAAEALAREGESLTVHQLSETLVPQSTLTEDWQYSLGSYFTDVDVINLTVTEENGVKKYSATIKYVVTDFYNWDSNNKNAFAKIGPSPYELHELHKAGLAREFLTYGEISYNVTWTEGQTVSDLGI